MKNHQIYLQKNEKMYNDLIKELERDIKNKQTNINKYEQNIKECFVKPINYNIRNIMSPIRKWKTKENYNKEAQNKHIIYSNLINMCHTIKNFIKYHTLLSNANITNNNINSIYSKISDNIINEFVLIVSSMVCIEHFIETNDFCGLIVDVNGWEKEVNQCGKNVNQFKIQKDILHNKVFQNIDFLNSNKQSIVDIIDYFYESYAKKLLMVLVVTILFL